jgi:predicted esterase
MVVAEKRRIMTEKTIVAIFFFSLLFWGQSSAEHLPRGRETSLFILHPNKTVLASIGLSREQIKRVPDSATMGLYFPSGYRDGSSIPIFFVMPTDGESGIPIISSYVLFADKLHFAVAGFEFPAESDMEEARYYYCLHVIYLFRKNGIIRNQPVWIGGFSGGGLWSLHMCAWGGDRFNGVLAAGCNQDFASVGFCQMKNQKAFDVPIAMLNGTADEIAGTDHWNYYHILWTMKNTGFKNIKIFVYDGGHSLPYQETLDAFVWLKKCYEKKSRGGR